MYVIEDLKRIHKIHKLIFSQQTGSPDEFASTLCVSRRELYYMLQELKNMGAEINYSRTRHTFCYTNKFEMMLTLNVRALGKEETKIIGGCSQCSKGFVKLVAPCSNFAQSKYLQDNICKSQHFPLTLHK